MLLAKTSTACESRFYCLQLVCCCCCTRRTFKRGQTQQRVTRVSPQMGPGGSSLSSNITARRGRQHTNTNTHTIIHHTSPTAIILTSVSPAPPWSHLWRRPDGRLDVAQVWTLTPRGHFNEQPAHPAAPGRRLMVPTASKASNQFCSAHSISISARRHGISWLGGIDEIHSHNSAGNLFH